MPTMLNFKYGLHENLPAYDSSRVGSIYVTTDEQAMYVDLPAGRIRVSQLITLSGISEWEKLTPPYSTEAFYYIADANALLKYNGKDWVQINSTKAITDALSALEASVKNQLENFESRLDDHDATIGSLTADVGQLKTDVQTVQGTVNNHDSRLEVAEKDLSTLKNDLAQETINRENADQKHTQDIQGLTTKVTEEINRSTEKDKTLEAAIQEEVNTARAAEKENADNIAKNASAIEEEVKNRQEAIQKLSEKFEQNGTDVADLQQALAEETSAREAADTALGERITQNANNIATNATNIDNHKQLLDAEVKRSTAEDSRLAGLIAENTANITANKTAIEKEISDREAANAELQTTIEQEISDRKAAVQELTKTVTDNMQTADAMKFMGTVSSSAELLSKETGAEIGHTYKAVAEFMDGDVVTISFANDDHKVYIGDLLIASGDEENGVITGDVVWLHVPSGYTADYNPEMSVAENGTNKVTISLTSGAANSTGDLGAVIFEAAADSCVTVSSDNTGVVVGMAWGTF